MDFDLAIRGYDLVVHFVALVNLCLLLLPVYPHKSRYIFRFVDVCLCSGTRTKIPKKISRCPHLKISIGKVCPRRENGCQDTPRLLWKHHYHTKPSSCFATSWKNQGSKKVWRFFGDGIVVMVFIWVILMTVMRISLFYAWVSVVLYYLPISAK